MLTPRALRSRLLRRPDRVRAASTSPRGHAQSGFSMAELLTVVALMGLIAVGSATAWQRSAARARSTAAARTFKTLMHQARMKSIQQGINHFVVLDREAGVLEIYEDTGTTVGSFDSSDPRAYRREYPPATLLAFPEGVSSLSSPLDASTVSDAWSIPDPDSSARWGTTLLGLMTTPTGLLSSAEATPSPISSGVIVFSGGGVTTAVGVRGLQGSVRAWEFFDGAWREI